VCVSASVQRAGTVIVATNTCIFSIIGHTQQATFKHFLTAGFGPEIEPLSDHYTPVLVLWPDDSRRKKKKNFTYNVSVIDNRVKTHICD
jgi:hypothetical protein